MTDLVNRIVEVYSDGGVEGRDWPTGIGQDGPFGATEVIAVKIQIEPFQSFPNRRDGEPVWN
jgi:hypothetical protein